MLATLFHACASASFRSSRDSPGRRASGAYVVVGVRALRVDLEVAHLGVEPDVDRRAARAALVPRDERVGRRVVLRHVELVVDFQAVVVRQLERAGDGEVAAVRLERPRRVAEAGQVGDEVRRRRGGGRGREQREHFGDGAVEPSAMAISRVTCESCCG